MKHIKILIAGGTGFVGTFLAKHLSKQENYKLYLLTRKKVIKTKYFKEIIFWENLNSYENNFDVIINLCGYGIANKRWSKKIKTKIINSRIIPTNNLISFIGKSNTKLINASAIGSYPFSKQQQSEHNTITTTSLNSGFSQKITAQWENYVTNSNIKNWCVTRFGVVIGDGGFISKIRPLAKLGLASTFGNGNNLISWVDIRDLCNAINFIIANDIKGICNISANATTQKEIIQSISAKYNKKNFLKIPIWFVKLTFGKMGEEMLLSSSNIKSDKLTKAGFKFKYKNFNQIDIN